MRGGVWREGHGGEHLHAASCVVDHNFFHAGLAAVPCSSLACTRTREPDARRERPNLPHAVLCLKSVQRCPLFPEPRPPNQGQTDRSGRRSAPSEWLSRCSLRRKGSRVLRNH
eukprot:937368-Rhodomonas_salina.2